MGLRQLEYMIKVAEERSFSKAAQKLNIAQPSLSQYILNLEQNIGITLFDRTTNPISLTHAGEVFAVKAREILKLYNELNFQMKDMAGLKIGKIIIGVSQTGINLIPQVLPHFHKKYPHIEIEIIESSSAEEMEKMINDGIVDLGTLILPIYSDNLSYEIIQEEKMLLALPIDHPFAVEMKKKSTKQYPEISFSVLEKEKFILPKGTQRTRIMLNKLFKEVNFTPKILCETQTMDVACAIVASGIGVCFVLPETIRIDYREKLALFSLNTAYATRILVLAYKREKYLPKIAHEFLSIAKKFTK